jgi:hypothetical protein
MPPEEKTVIDEMNAALGDLIAPESETPEPEITEEELPAEEGEEELPAEEGEPDTETDEEAEARSSDRNADGTFKKKEPATETDGTLTTAASKEPAKKDPINDPIPENLKKDTSERIRSLIDTAKTLTSERDQYKTDFDFLVKGVEATGTTPAQYGETLSWLSLFNNGIKGDAAQLEKAYELVEQVAERCALLLGKDRSIADPLKGHADLAAAVQSKQITQEYAKEIARTRNGQQFRQELTTQQTTAEQATAAEAKELADGRAALTELGNNLAASDPSYAAKKDIVVAALQPLFRRGSDGKYIIRPSQWKEKFSEAYRNVRIGAPAATKPIVPANQPLRAGKQPAGGQAKQPSNALEAMNAALAGMNK